jgi:GR25 family glycosyltransferase involved in LPS biosynthesis
MADWVSWLRQQNLFQIGIFVGEPYVDVFVSDFRFLTELSICYYYLGEYEKAFNCSQKLLQHRMDEQLSSSVLFNMHFCIPHIKDKFIGYSTVTPPDTKLGLVTLTVTTCKRFDLFEKTINSFINCCKDIHLIDRWICIDDNSSESDRQKMKDKYPFFEFILKNPDEKGHAQSMNRLYSSGDITTPWIFHMEDDWQFFIPDNYITKCIKVLQGNPMYGQCLVNKNYAETFEDVRIVGGIFKQLSDGMRYYEHEYTNDKYKNSASCAYWPHYSLRVGMSRNSMYKRVGSFDETAAHFEMDYAYRYVSAGYTTTFLEGINSTHIGRLTSERDSEKDNAYSLNNELQFVDKNTKKGKFVVINLERRPDRYNEFTSRVDNKFPVERYQAVDGNLLNPTRQIEQLFNHNDYNYRRGMIGCALSHIDIWINLINDAECEYYIVLEDDIEFADEFDKKCHKLVQSAGWDIIFLGHHLYESYKTADVYDRVSDPTIEKWNSIKSLSQSLGGTGGYIINKMGAINMLLFIQNNGMTNGIDTMMQHACDTLNVFYCHPHIIYSECATRENLETVDSDIQRDYSSLKRTIEERVTDEIKYFENLDIPVYEFMNPPSEVSDDIVSIIYGTDISMSSGGMIYYIGTDVSVCIPPIFLNVVGKNYRLLMDAKFKIEIE